MRQHWTNLCTVIGVALLVLGATQYVPTTTNGQGNFRKTTAGHYPTEARTEMVAGAALAAIGVLNRHKRQ